jgi:hypothetical protein
MATLESPYDICDAVFIDGDRSIRAVITGMCWRGNGLTIECAWVHNGSPQTHWIEAWRLSKAQ